MLDVIIIGGGASGLFCSLNASKKAKKLILEKNSKCGTKILLSGGERCNITNKNINIETDYIGENTKILFSAFSKFSNEDLISYLKTNGIETIKEDNGKILLKSGKAKQIVDFLVNKATQNNTQIKYNQEITNIKKINNIFEIKTQNNIYHSKNLVIATGGRSYHHIGATDFGYKIAEQFGIKINQIYKGLCGIITKEDLGLLSGSSTICNLKCYDKNKLIYQKEGNLLFTHFGLSGPMIFDLSLFIGKNKSHYSDIKIEIEFDINNTTKKINKHFILTEKDNIRILNIQELRNWKEAKVTGGGINLKEIKHNFECKNISGLFIIGELLDITGITGGYNLQFAFTSGYICGKNF